MKSLKKRFYLPVILCCFTTQIALANFPDSTDVLISRPVLESLVIKAYHNEECKINLGECNLNLTDSKRKIAKRNTAIEMLSGIIAALTAAVILKK